LFIACLHREDTVSAETRDYSTRLNACNAIWFRDKKVVLEQRTPRESKTV